MNKCGRCEIPIPDIEYLHILNDDETTTAVKIKPIWCYKCKNDYEKAVESK